MQVKKVEIDVNQLRERLNLFVATPMYGGNCMEPYFRSCIQLLTFFNKHNLPVAFGTIANESLITRARNTLLAYFLNSKCSHLMFIDGDIRFSVEDVIKLIYHDKDVIVGAYPKKGLAWDKIAGNILHNQNKRFTSQELAAFGSDYAINFKFVNREERTIAIEDGLIELHDAGTGFMLIKREAIMKMIQSYPELKYNNDVTLNDDSVSNNFYAMFDTMIDPKDRRYLSEDYTFCRRWQDIGGKIWLDPSISLDHYGHFGFVGNPNAIINFNEPVEQVEESLDIKSIELPD